MRIQKTRRFKLFSTISLLAILATGCTTIRPATVTDPQPPSETTFSHALYDRVLGQHVDDNGMVNYTTLKAAPETLQDYYRLIASYSPDSHPERFPDDNHKLAYLINAYNAGAKVIVLQHYPIESVLDVKNPRLFFFLTKKAGFFLFRRLSFGGRTTSLYYLENSVVRKRFKDPRIHFALNCASMSCPRLPRKAFTGEMLDKQLDTEIRFFLSEPRNFKFDHDAETIYLSSIFKWNKKDFAEWVKRKYPGREASLLSYISLYLPTKASQELEQVAGRYTIKYRPYDWGLNDQYDPGKSMQD